MVPVYMFEWIAVILVVFAALVIVYMLKDVYSTVSTSARINSTRLSVDEVLEGDGSCANWPRNGPAPKVAIIGAGVGGTSAAYFLNTMLSDNVDIHVYNGSKVGGRASLVKFDGLYYEAGAGFLHKDNMYMAGFAKTFGLARVPVTYEGNIGFFDGFKLIFRTSSNAMWSVVRLLWRYGLSLVTLTNFVNSNYDKFIGIYKLQKEGKAFKTVPEMLDAIDPRFHHTTQVSTRHFFVRELGLSKKLVDELVTSAISVIYDQGSSASAFVALTSLAGTQRDCLWHVKGGNYQLAQNCLKASGAMLHDDDKVVSVRKQISKDGAVTYDVSDSAHSATTYDAIILAAPLCHCGIKFEGFAQSDPINSESSMQPYHQTVATFVKGEINQSFFGHCAELDGPFPLTVLTTEMINPDTKTSSHAVPFPVDFAEAEVRSFRQEVAKQPVRVWKVFSSERLSKSDLSKLFVSYEECHDIVWSAYPHFSPPESFTSFVLDGDRMFYINSIEKVASAMEMSVIGAKNAALLLRNSFA